MVSKAPVLSSAFAALVHILSYINYRFTIIKFQWLQSKDLSVEVVFLLLYDCSNLHDYIEPGTHHLTSLVSRRQ